MSKFWDKVYKCEHKNISPDYLELVGCATPYCVGSEIHCLDCGVYITECGCNCQDGLSGWPLSRWKRLRWKKLHG